MRYLPPLPSKFKGAAILATLAMALCGFFAVFGSRGMAHLYRVQRQQMETESVAYALTLENQRLREHLLRLDSDDGYLEKVARERLGWIKPGEFVYRTSGRARSAPRTAPVIGTKRTAPRD